MKLVTIVGKVGKLESLRLESFANNFNFTFYREFFRLYFYRSSNEVHVIVSRNSFWVYFFFFPIVWLPRPDPLNQRVKIRVPLNLESSHARPLNVVDWRLDRRSVSDQIQSSRYQESTMPSPRIYKVGRVYPMVVVSILSHAEFGGNDHREDASHFKTQPTLLTHSKFPIFPSPNDTISCRSIKQHFNKKLPKLYWTTRCIQSVLDRDH